jgi:hypothetical protein
VVAAQEAVNLLIFQFLIKEGYFHVVLPPKTMAVSNKLLALSGQLSATNIINRQSQIVLLLKHDLYNIIHSLYREEFYLSLYIGRNFNKLSHILFRNYDLFNASSKGGKGFFL